MSPHEKGRIGIIEDDLVVGGTLAHRLELEGYTPLWWHTGREALEGLSAQRPDLVVCDILLPDMSGKDVFCGLCRSLAASRSCLSPPTPRSRTPFT